MINTSGSPPRVSLGTAIGVGLALLGVGMDIGANAGAMAGWFGLVLTLIGVVFTILAATIATVRHRRRAHVRP